MGSNSTSDLSRLAEGLVRSILTLSELMGTYEFKIPAGSVKVMPRVKVLQINYSKMPKDHLCSKILKGL